MPSSEGRPVVAMLAVVAVLLAGVLVALGILIGRGLTPSASPREPELAASARSVSAPPDTSADTARHLSPPRPAPSTPHEATPPPRPRRPSAVVIPVEIVHAFESLTLRDSVAIYIEPDAASEVILRLPGGAAVELRGRYGAFALLQWSTGDAVLLGWIPWPHPAAQRRSDRGVVKGSVKLTGSPPEMKVPALRARAEACQSREIVHNAVIAQGGLLKDTFVRLEGGDLRLAHSPPAYPAVVTQRDCVYAPRIQGAVTGQELSVSNDDATLHNVHTYRGDSSWFNQAQPKGAEPVRRALDEPGVHALTCDVHPWMRAFVVVTDHPFFAVSDDRGRFSIEGVPPGTYTLEAWHSRYGWKRRAAVTITAGAEATVDISYDAGDPEPKENKGELRYLF